MLQKWGWECIQLRIDAFMERILVVIWKPET